MSTETPSDAGDAAQETDWLELVKTQLAGMRYGSIQLSVRDGRVLQVEAIEKMRLGGVPEKPGREGR